MIVNLDSVPCRDAPTQKRLRDGAAALSARWEHLPTEALHGLTRAILVRMQVHADRIDLDVASGRLVRWLLDEGGKEAIDARPGWGIFEWWRQGAERARDLNVVTPMVRLLAPVGMAYSQVQTLSALHLTIPADRIVTLTEEDAGPLKRAGWTEVDPRLGCRRRPRRIAGSSFNDYFLVALN